MTVDGLSDPLTVRAGGDVDLHYGDTIRLSPMMEHLHKFDAAGLRVA